MNKAQKIILKVGGTKVLETWVTTTNDNAERVLRYLLKDSLKNVIARWSENEIRNIPL